MNEKEKMKINLPIQIGNDSEVESYASKLVNGEERILVTREGNIYLTNGEGGTINITQNIKDLINSDSNGGSNGNISDIVGDLESLKTENKNNLVEAINEVFTNVSNFKEKLATAITDKGVVADSDDSIEVLLKKVEAIPVSDIDFNGKEDKTVICGENISAGDIVKILNIENELTRFSKTEGDPIPDIFPSYCPNNVEFFHYSDTFVASLSYAPYLLFYRKKGETFILDNERYLKEEITLRINKITISPDDSLLFLHLNVSPFLKVLKKGGDSKYHEVDLNGVDLPKSVINSISFNEKDNLVVMGCKTSPYLQFYSLNVNEAKLTKLEIEIPEESKITNYINDVHFRNHLNILVVGTAGPQGTENFFVYEYTDEGTLVLKYKERIGSTTSGTPLTHTMFSPDGNYISAFHSYNTQKRVLFYKYTEDGNVVKLPMMSTAISATPYAVKWMKDSNSILVATSTKTTVPTIVRNGDEFSISSNRPEEFPVDGNCKYMTLNSRGNLLVCNYNVAPYLYIFRVEKNLGQYAYKVNNTDFFNKCEGIGLMTEDGNEGDYRLVKQFLKHGTDTAYYSHEQMDEMVNLAVERELEFRAMK